MDSLNLSGKQKIQVNSRNTASNTIPIPCASCGSKEHIQPFSQADCFRAHCPFTSSQKKSAENCENNFAVQQSFFPSFPLLHPIFNTFVPQNVYFSQSNVAPPGSIHYPEESKKENTDSQKTSRSLGTSTGFQFCPSVKPERKVNEQSSVFTKNDSVPNGTAPGYEFHPQELVDPTCCNPYFPRCTCNSPLPWPCNPFIVPIISYYLLWNPHHGSVKIPSNACPEAEKVKKNEDITDKENSGVSIETKVTSENSDCNEIIVKDTNVKAIKDEFLEIDKATVDPTMSIHNNESCTSILSIFSLHYADNECFNLCKIIDDRANCLENEIKKNDSFPLERVYFETDSKKEKIIGYELRNPSESSLSDIIKSNTNLAVSKNSTNLKEQLDLLELDSKKKSNVTSKNKKNIVFQCEHRPEIKEETLKKEHFTLVSRKREDLQAAGDLGGKNCYAVSISAFDNQGNKLDTIKKRNFEQGEALAKVGLFDVEVQSSQQNKTEIIHDISVGSEIKCPKLKSGIAKLSCNFKLQESKPDTESGKHGQKHIQQKETTIRKHNCLSTEVKIDGNDNNSKYEKTKFLIKEQPKGKGKSNPKGFTLEIKGQTSGKEDRGRLLSVQERNLAKVTHQSLQPTTKTISISGIL